MRPNQNRRGRPKFGAARRFVGLVVWLGTLVLLAGASAQTSAPSGFSGNRFLFVFETSAAMQRQAGAVQKAVGAILTSGASGQLREGDTLGVWTFDDDLHAGLFPLQTWRDADKQALASLIAGFFKQQPAGKASRLDKALEGVVAVARSSETITVFLFCTGDQPVKGTSFDQEINADFKANVRSMGRKRMPFIAVLQARRGKFVAYTLNTLPWPVIIPAFPTTLAANERRLTVPAIASTVVSNSPAPPAARQTNDVASVPTSPARAAPATNLPPTATAAIVQPAPPKVEAAKPPQPETAPEVVAAPSPNRDPTPPVLKVPAKPADPVVALPGPSTNVQPSPESVSQLKIKNGQRTMTNTGAPVAPEPARAASREPAPPARSTNSVPPAEAREKLQPLLPAHSATAMPATKTSEIAAVVSPPPATRPRSLLLGGLSLLAAGVGLAVWLVRRPGRTPTASLISQSMNQRRK